MGPSQRLAFCFLLLVIAVTSVQVVRVAWWVLRDTRSTAGGGRDAAAAARLSSRAMLVAHSTRGLARAAVWLTCAGGAVGLYSALIVIVNTSEPGASVLVRQHLEVLEPSGIALGLCALLLAVSLAFDRVAARTGRQSPVSVDSGRVVLLRRGPGLVALVLVSWLLLDLRPAYAALVSTRDPLFMSATLDLLQQLWLRLSAILAVAGVLAWLATLFESALLRRRLGQRISAAG